MLKKELQELVKKLESDIRDLVLRPYSYESMMIKSKVTMENDLEMAMWIGSHKSSEKPEFEGLLKKYTMTNALDIKLLEDGVVEAYSEPKTN